MPKLQLLFVALIVFSGIGLEAQECGTITTQQDIEYLQQLLPKLASFRQNQSRFSSEDKIPVKVYVINDVEGTGGISAVELQASFKRLNEHYSPIGMEFFICETVQINSDDFFDFNAGTLDNDEQEIIQNYYTPGIVNLYCTNRIVSRNGNALCGYAYFPSSGIDRIFMANQCMLNGSTLAHEFGHFFSLFHTHETNAGPGGAELIDGSNCDLGGDLICDTPADPRLYENEAFKVDPDCNYIGVDTDANGDPYQPNVRNIMSYSRKVCRDFFSPIQLEIMRYTWLNDRSYLACATEEVAICELATEIDCGELINGSLANGTNVLKASDYNCYEGGKRYEGLEKVYKFTLEKRTDVSVILSKLSGEADLFILDQCAESFNCVAQGINPSLEDENIKLDQLAPGDYYLVVEGAEDANTSTFELNISCSELALPNLVCGQLGELTIKRDVLTISGLTITNIGSVKSTGAKMGYYLSNNQLITNKDIYLGSDFIEPLEPGMGNVEMFRKSIKTLPNGSYYIGMILDEKERVEESNEQDNTCFFPNKLQIGPSTAECKCTSTNGSICENFQAYTNEQRLGPQSACWTTWSGTEGRDQDGLIERSEDANQYLSIIGQFRNGGPQDVVLQLGNKTEGIYKLSFDLFIGTDYKAYFNVLHQFIPGGSNNEWAQDVYFLGAGEGSLRAANRVTSFSYPVDQWMKVEQVIDLEQDSSSLSIEGVKIFDWKFSAQSTAVDGTKQLSALNFFPLDHTHQFYVDNLGLAPVEDSQELPDVDPVTPGKRKVDNRSIDLLEVDVFPNPTSGFIYMDINGPKNGEAKVQVRNMLGQLIETKWCNPTSDCNTGIDLSNQKSGLYLVEVELEGLKIVKRVLLQ